MIFDAEDASGLGGESVKGGGLEPPFAFNHPPAGGKPARNLAFLAQKSCIPGRRKKKSSATEQRGMCAGGKRPPARSINRFFKLFKV